MYPFAQSSTPQALPHIFKLFMMIGVEQLGQPRLFYDT